MKTRFLWVPLVSMLSLSTMTHAGVDVQFAARVPGSSIGINMSSYPSMELVPGLPVYYSPESDSNYFYFDGLYWSYQGDYWYASDWYDGPWVSVSRHEVPFFILRVPVVYYVRPPHFFAGWQLNQAPHWGERWGREWEQDHRGWDKWDRGLMPRPAPLPAYQRHHQRDNYPRSARQRYAIRSENFGYRPRSDFNRHYLDRPQSNERGQSRPPRIRQQRDERLDTRPQMPHRNNRRQPDERVQVVRPQLPPRSNIPRPQVRPQVRPDANRQQPGLHRLPQAQRTQPNRHRSQTNRQSSSDRRRQNCNLERRTGVDRCRIRR